MRDMERQKFDGEWGKAFDQAEVSPSDQVWTNIELDLEKAKGTQLKKRLVFYQLLAAASVFLAMGVGLAVFVNESRPVETRLAVQSSAVQPPEKKKSAPSTAQADTRVQPNQLSPAISLSLPNTPAPGGSQKPSLKNDKKHNRGIALVNNDVTSVNPRAQSPVAGVNKKAELNPELLSHGSGMLPELVMPKRSELQLSQLQNEPTVDPVALMLARLEQREKEVGGNSETRSDSNEKLWTSVGFAAGAFNSINGGISPASSNTALAANKPIADEEAQASGITYSFGVNLGTKVSRRWIVQGGVNYLTQSSDYTARTAVAVETSKLTTSFRPQSINELDKLGEGNSTAEKIIPTSPYTVNNNLRYLSIPLQAGYLLVDKVFGLQLSAGVATDVFLQNTVTAEGSSLNKTSQGIGEDSPYRAVNLSGLVGTEVSYRFGKHYRVALNPGIRYPFNSIYRSELDVKASPLAFDIGLRFRYIFH